MEKGKQGKSVWMWFLDDRGVASWSDGKCWQSVKAMTTHFLYDGHYPLKST